MKNQIAFTTIITLLAVANIGYTYDAYSLAQQNENIYPHIVQYIADFSINTNDLENVLNNQFRQIKLGEIKTSYAQIINSTVSLSHYGSEKRVQILNPVKVKVSNDTFSLFVIFSVRIFHTTRGKNYTCNTSIPLVNLSYVKQIDLQTGNIIISSFNSTFSSISFNKAVCNISQKGKDEIRIDQAVNSTQGSSIYIELNKFFQKTQRYFTQNSKVQHLSKIYDTNPYEYDYSGYKINVNVSTIQANLFGIKGVQNRISGILPQTAIAAVAPPPYKQGFSSYYSLQFFKNLIEYSKNNYPGWKNIKLNRNNMRNSIFKFRLIDFEYVIPTVLSKYPKNYLSDVEIQCNIEAVKQLTLQKDNVSQNIDWRCIGSFQVETGKKEIFLNFVASAKHTLLLSAEEKRLIIRIDAVEITNIAFDIIGDYEVTDPFTFAFYASEGLFEFRGFAIGSYFRINSPNQKIQYVADKGIWIG